MIKIEAVLISKLRDKTGAGVMECRNALIEADGELDKASEILKRAGLEKTAKRAERETLQGVVEVYSHMGGKVASMVEVNSETDFVARTEEFKKLIHEVAMQVAAMNPNSVEELLEQDYIRDSSKKVKDLIAEVAAKTGENIRVRRVARFALGE